MRHSAPVRILPYTPDANRLGGGEAAGAGLWNRASESQNQWLLVLCCDTVGNLEIAARTAGDISAIIGVVAGGSGEVDL